MDQETGSGRRRSSRLAARGVTTTTPKVETIAKKTAKTPEKPKRAKRKTTEGVVELPEAKKTKTTNKDDEVGVVQQEQTTNSVEKNNVSVVIAPMDVDVVTEPDVSSPSSVKNNDTLQSVGEKTDGTPPKDSKDKEIVGGEKAPAEVGKDKIVAIDDKVQPEVVKVTTEQENSGIAQGEPEQEPVTLDNTTANGESAGKETVVESAAVIDTVKNDVGFCVAAKDPPNGNVVIVVPAVADDQAKAVATAATNGDDKSVVESKPVVAVEPTKIVKDSTNHVIETDLKAITVHNAAAAAAVRNDDVSSVEQQQVGKEDEAKVIVDNASVVLVGDNASPPSTVDQTSTFVS